MLRSIPSKVALIILFALVLGYYDLPANLQGIPGTPESVKNARVHLGLDLQGGSQLDYKIDLRKVPEGDQKAIVEGVKTVINKRVNSLGVAEPNIYTSTVGNEQHLIVELAGVKDLEQAKKIVGKTIQLEFKEQREKEDPNYKENIRKLAQSFLARVASGNESFEVIAQEEAQASPEKVRFVEEPWKMMGEITEKKVADALASVKAGGVVARLIEGNDGYIFQDNQAVPLNGYFIAKLLERRETGALSIQEKALQVSHILVSYRGAERAAETIIRTREEARQRAQDIYENIKTGESFEKMAKTSSDEPGAAESAGKLPEPVKINGSYDEKFTGAALALTKKGEISPVVETPFGFHLIRADDLSQVRYSYIFVSTEPDPWQETGLTGQHFEHAEVTFDSFLQPTVSIQFNKEGSDLFEKITERNIEKPLAIFVGGSFISSPTVQSKIAGGQAVITGRFTIDEAQALARDLNTGAIPAPVVLTGQYTIGASLGDEALQKSLYAGIIGIIALIVFMVGYYRLPGFVAVLGLTVYTSILLFLIKSELSVPIALGAGIAIFAGVIYTILHSKDGGWEKFISFVLACFVLFFVTFLLSNAVVLTLAGIAGVILSIGMAVDANILIFERTKEELATGRPLSSAIEVGFDRAWSSIRDSNFSSLITCAILFYFGSSIIQGFAFNLAAGILVSMFTAITVTRTLLMAFMKTKPGSNLWLWGMKKNAGEKKTLRIVGKARTWFTLSGAVVLASLVLLVSFGLKLGIDFKGGTLMDLSFEKSVTAEEIKTELAVIEKSLSSGTSASSSSPAVTPTLESGAEPISFASARIIPTGENQFLINAEHIDNETHDLLLSEFEKKFGNVTENRFTTIGPVVGETLKRRAVTAVAIALVAIVLYIAFAFRKVPKHVSAWKFGGCAIVALVHDVLIPVGIFSLFQFEIDALFITAILTVLGFSVHDTIVVFDRIRENLKYQGNESFAETTDKSVSQTMARSINTSFTTIITLTALLLFGSASIFHFILVLVIGIFVGTYSSIFIASPLLVLWQKKSR